MEWLCLLTTVAVAVTTKQEFISTKGRVGGCPERHDRVRCLLLPMPEDTGIELRTETAILPPSKILLL
jgi:hypothetical protein